MKKLNLSMLILLVLMSNVYSSDSLTVVGKIFDQNGIGVENATIISDESITAVTNQYGEYSITVPKSNVGIDDFDYDLSERHNYKVKIYNLLGQKIFEQDYYNSIIKDFQWNGENQQGKLVGSGLYFPILQIDNNVIARNKITLVGKNILNKQPFSNFIQKQINGDMEILGKATSINSIFFDLQGDKFTNINGLGVNISDINNDNIYDAEDISINTYEIDTVTDMDGNVYKTVKIGDQWWMAENLRVTHYQNEDPIEYIKDRNLWTNTYKDYVPAYCFFKNDTSFIKDYGNFYNWYAATDDRQIAPEGWRVPSDVDFMVLDDYVGKDGGKKLKSTNEWLSYWQGIGVGSDEFGFCGKPIGYITTGGTFKIFGETACFWTNSKNDIYYSLYNRSSSFSHHSELWSTKTAGFSIRCIKGEIKTNNTAPVASFTIIKLDTVLLLFDGTTSYDYENKQHELKVCWNWYDGDNMDDIDWNTSLSYKKTHIYKYDTEEEINLSMMVLDKDGKTDTLTSKFSINDIPFIENSKVTDIDGNMYKTVKIGNLWWMAENLSVQHFQNGDTIEGVYIYDNMIQNKNKYGLLYNFNAVDDKRNLAPEDWRVATDDDWKQMELYIGMDYNELNKTGGYRGNNESQIIKSKGGWYQNKNGVDYFGLNIMPGGYLYNNGEGPINIKRGAYYWTSSGIRRWIDYKREGIGRGFGDKCNCFSIRCVKDAD